MKINGLTMPLYEPDRTDLINKMYTEQDNSILFLDIRLSVYNRYNLM